MEGIGRGEQEKEREADEGGLSQEAAKRASPVPCNPRFMIIMLRTPNPKALNE